MPKEVARVFHTMATPSRTMLIATSMLMFPSPNTSEGH